MKHICGFCDSVVTNVDSVQIRVGCVDSVEKNSCKILNGIGTNEAACYVGAVRCGNVDSVESRDLDGNKRISRAKVNETNLRTSSGRACIKETCVE